MAFWVADKNVHPLEQAAWEAMLEEAAHVRGRMLCAQYLVQHGTGSGPGILRAELPTLLSRCPTANSNSGGASNASSHNDAAPAAAVAGAAAAPRCALLVVKDVERGEAYPRREMEIVHELAPGVPLAGVYCSGVIGPNLPNHYSSLRCITDPANVVAAPAAPEVEGVDAAQALQAERLAVDRSDVLGMAVSLALLAG
ncbi:hypothetical protein ABPG75_008102 [Micractinium tetrahymenae]